MLTEAERCAADAGIADRLRTLVVDIAREDLPFAPATFDVVLCHNVVQYLPDPEPLLRTASDLLKPDGWLSLLAPNPASEALRHALQLLDFQGALDHLDCETHRNLLFDVEIRLSDLPTLLAFLGNAALTPVDYRGVRCVNDYIREDEVKFSAEGFERLLALELAMGRRSPYRDIARLWQILARKFGSAV